MRPLKPITAYYTIQGIYGILLMALMIVMIIYRVDVVGMNPFQLLVAAAVFRLVTFVAEVPTGVVADAFSRKISTLIGYVLIGIGTLVEATLPQYWVVLVGLSIVAIHSPLARL